MCIGQLLKDKVVKFDPLTTCTNALFDGVSNVEKAREILYPWDFCLHGDKHVLFLFQ